MEEFRKNVAHQQSLMFEQRDLKEIEKVIFSSGFIYSTFYGHLTLLLLNEQAKNVMKRRRGPKTKRKKTIIAEESEDNEEEEESEDAVEAIVDFKQSKRKGSGGYLLYIKWVGYTEKITHGSQ